MISARDIEQAYSVLKDVVVRTPLDFNRYLKDMEQASISREKMNSEFARLKFAVLIMPFHN